MSKNKPYGDNRCLLYQITVIPTGAYYIGRSFYGKERWRRHLTELRHKRHGNDRLQKAFNKYGKDALRFESIAWVLKDTGVEDEQFLLDQCKGDPLCMNLCWESSTPPNTKGRKKGRQPKDVLIQKRMTLKGEDYGTAKRNHFILRHRGKFRTEEQRPK